MLKPHLIMILSLGFSLFPHQTTTPNLTELPQSQRIANDQCSGIQQTIKSWSKSLLTPIGIGLGLYGLSRWTISKKTATKELDNWIIHQYEYCKPSNKDQIIFFRGWSYADKMQDAYEAERYFSKLLPTELSFKYFSPGFRNTRRFNSFAQKWDVYQVKNHIEHILRLKIDSTKKTVVFAHCNGASALISALFLHPELAEKISGVVLFAPYSEISEVGGCVNYLQRAIRSKTAIKRVIQSTIAPNYSCSAKSPLELIKTGTVRKDLPIILVHSLDDELVPMKNFHAIKNAFKVQNYTQFYGLQRSEGNHFPFDFIKGHDTEVMAQLGNLLAQQILAASTI